MGNSPSTASSAKSHRKKGNKRSSGKKTSDAHRAQQPPRQQQATQPERSVTARTCANGEGDLATTASMTVDVDVATAGGSAVNSSRQQTTAAAAAAQTHGNALTASQEPPSSAGRGTHLPDAALSHNASADELVGSSVRSAAAAPQPQSEADRSGRGAETVHGTTAPETEDHPVTGPQAPPDDSEARAAGPADASDARRNSGDLHRPHHTAADHRRHCTQEGPLDGAPGPAGDGGGDGAGQLAMRHSGDGLSIPVRRHRPPPFASPARSPNASGLPSMQNRLNTPRGISGGGGADVPGSSAKLIHSGSSSQTVHGDGAIRSQPQPLSWDANTPKLSLFTRSRVDGGAAAGAAGAGAAGGGGRVGEDDDSTTDTASTVEHDAAGAMGELKTVSPPREAASRLARAPARDSQRPPQLLETQKDVPRIPSHEQRPAQPSGLQRATGARELMPPPQPLPSPPSPSAPNDVESEEEDEKEEKADEGAEGRTAPTDDEDYSSSSSNDSRDHSSSRSVATPDVHQPRHEEVHALHDAVELPSFTRLAEDSPRVVGGPEGSSAGGGGDSISPKTSTTGWQLRHQQHQQQQHPQQHRGAVLTSPRGLLGSPMGGSGSSGSSALPTGSITSTDTEFVGFFPPPLSVPTTPRYKPGSVHAPWPHAAGGPGGGPHAATTVAGMTAPGQGAMQRPSVLKNRRRPSLYAREFCPPHPVAGDETKAKGSHASPGRAVAGQGLGAEGSENTFLDASPSRGRDVPRGVIAAGGHETNDSSRQGDESAGSGLPALPRSIAPSGTFHIERLPLESPPISPGEGEAADAVEDEYGLVHSGSNRSATRERSGEAARPLRRPLLLPPSPPPPPPPAHVSRYADSDDEDEEGMGGTSGGQAVRQGGDPGAPSYPKLSDTSRLARPHGTAQPPPPPPPHEEASSTRRDQGGPIDSGAGMESRKDSVEGAETAGEWDEEEEEEEFVPTYVFPIALSQLRNDSNHQQLQRSGHKDVQAFPYPSDRNADDGGLLAPLRSFSPNSDTDSNGEGSRHIGGLARRRSTNHPSGSGPVRDNAARTRNAPRALNSPRGSPRAPGRARAATAKHPSGAHPSSALAPSPSKEAVVVPAMGRGALRSSVNSSSSGRDCGSRPPQQHSQPYPLLSSSQRQHHPLWRERSTPVQTTPPSTRRGSASSDNFALATRPVSNGFDEDCETEDEEDEEGREGEEEEEAHHFDDDVVADVVKTDERPRYSARGDRVEQRSAAPKSDSSGKDIDPTRNSPSARKGKMGNSLSGNAFDDDEEDAELWEATAKGTTHVSAVAAKATGTTTAPPTTTTREAAAAASAAEAVASRATSTSAAAPPRVADVGHHLEVSTPALQLQTSFEASPYVTDDVMSLHDANCACGPLMPTFERVDSGASNASTAVTRHLSSNATPLPPPLVGMPALASSTKDGKGIAKHVASPVVPSSAGESQPQTQRQQQQPQPHTQQLLPRRRRWTPPASPPQRIPVELPPALQQQQALPPSGGGAAPSISSPDEAAVTAAVAVAVAMEGSPHSFPPRRPTASSPIQTRHFAKTVHGFVPPALGTTGEEPWVPAGSGGGSGREGSHRFGSGSLSSHSAHTANAESSGPWWNKNLRGTPLLSSPHSILPEYDSEDDEEGHAVHGHGRVAKDDGASHSHSRSGTGSDGGACQVGEEGEHVPPARESCRSRIEDEKEGGDGARSGDPHDGGGGDVETFSRDDTANAEESSADGDDVLMALNHRDDAERGSEAPTRVGTTPFDTSPSRLKEMGDAMRPIGGAHPCRSQERSLGEGQEDSNEVGVRGHCPPRDGVADASCERDLAKPAAALSLPARSAANPTDATSTVHRSERDSSAPTLSALRPESNGSSSSSSSTPASTSMRAGGDRGPSGSPDTAASHSSSRREEEVRRCVDRRSPLAKVSAAVEAQMATARALLEATEQTRRLALEEAEANIALMYAMHLERELAAERCASLSVSRSRDGSNARPHTQQPAGSRPERTLTMSHDNTLRGNSFAASPLGVELTEVSASTLSMTPVSSFPGPRNVSLTSMHTHMTAAASALTPSLPLTMGAGSPVANVPAGVATAAASSPAADAAPPAPASAAASSHLQLTAFMTAGPPPDSGEESCGDGDSGRGSRAERGDLPGTPTGERRGRAEDADTTPSTASASDKALATASLLDDALSTLTTTVATPQLAVSCTSFAGSPHGSAAVAHLASLLNSSTVAPPPAIQHLHPPPPPPPPPSTTAGAPPPHRYHHQHTMSASDAVVLTQSPPSPPVRIVGETAACFAVDGDDDGSRKDDEEDDRGAIADAPVVPAVLLHGRDEPAAVDATWRSLTNTFDPPSSLAAAELRQSSAPVRSATAVPAAHEGPATVPSPGAAAAATLTTATAAAGLSPAASSPLCAQGGGSEGAAEVAGAAARGSGSGDGEEGPEVPGLARGSNALATAAVGQTRAGVRAIPPPPSPHADPGEDRSPQREQMPAHGTPADRGHGERGEAAGRPFVPPVPSPEGVSAPSRSHREAPNRPALCSPARDAAAHETGAIPANRAPAGEEGKAVGKGAGSGSPSPVRPDQRVGGLRRSSIRGEPSVGQVVCRYCEQPYTSTRLCPVAAKSHDYLRALRREEKRVKKAAQALLREGKVRQAVELLASIGLVSPSTTSATAAVPIHASESSICAREASHPSHRSSGGGASASALPERRAETPQLARDEEGSHPTHMTTLRDRPRRGFSPAGASPSPPNPHVGVAAQWDGVGGSFSPR